MNELKLKLPGGGLLTIRKVAGEEQDSVMVEFFEPGENPDMDLGHGSSMTANVFAGAVRNVIRAAAEPNPLSRLMKDTSMTIKSMSTAGKTQCVRDVLKHLGEFGVEPGSEVDAANEGGASE